MKNRNPTLWLVWAVALFPLLLAVAMYYGGLWIPQQKVNAGELLPPGKTLSMAAFKDTRGNLHQASGRWQLLLSVPRVCDELCQHWQSHFRQILILLGRERVEMHLVIWDETGGVKQISKERMIWLADPIGNLILRYRQDQTPQDLLKDLKRLLKISKIG